MCKRDLLHHCKFANLQFVHSENEQKSPLRVAEIYNMHFSSSDKGAKPTSRNVQKPYWHWRTTTLFACPQMSLVHIAFITTSTTSTTTIITITTTSTITTMITATNILIVFIAYTGAT